MLSELNSNLQLLVSNIKAFNNAFCYALLAVLLVNLINWYLLGKSLNLLGLRPRTLLGIPGILFAPVLHSDSAHLIFNLVPFAALSLLIIGQSFFIYFELSANLLLAVGISLWLFGRPRIYIGASGIVTGYFSYLLAAAYYNKSLLSIVIAMLILYFFMGILVGLFPSDNKVAWEAHVLGFVAGIAHYTTFSNWSWLSNFWQQVFAVF